MKKREQVSEADQNYHPLQGADNYVLVLEKNNLKEELQSKGDEMIEGSDVVVAISSLFFWVQQDVIMINGHGLVEEK